MKKTLLLIGLISITFSFQSCDSNNEQITTKSETNSEEIKHQDVVSKGSDLDDEMTMESIDKMRSEIESLKIEAIEIPTTDLREKIKQKWSKIHFYVDNDVVVKIKTYPHSQISKRTEEFYTNQDGLRLVVIEDDGDGPKGKSKKEIDRMYYFHNDHLTGELKHGEEQDYRNNKSAAERLTSEFNDYLEIYENKK